MTAAQRREESARVVPCDQRDSCRSRRSVAIRLQLTTRGSTPVDGWWAAGPGRRQSRVPPGCPRGRAPAPVLWRHAAARPSATATRVDAPWSSAVSTMPGHHRTTGHHRISGSGTQDRFPASRVLPCLPWSGSRPPAGVKEGPKWREQSQFAWRSKCLCSGRLSTESSPA
jgi:hypothetical protein